MISLNNLRGADKIIKKTTHVYPLWTLQTNQAARIKSSRVMSQLYRMNNSIYRNEIVFIYKIISYFLVKKALIEHANFYRFK